MVALLMKHSALIMQTDEGKRVLWNVRFELTALLFCIQEV